MDKRIVRTAIVGMILAFLAFAPLNARAQGTLEPTQIAVGAPTQAHPGDVLTVQAVLADSRGRPIPQAMIVFTTQAQFLSHTGDVVLAQAFTNANGQAVVEFVDDLSGTFALSAEFRGDTRYAPSNATIEVAAAGEQQVYVEHVGVDIPGLNVPPRTVPMAYVSSAQPGILRFVDSLWPAMNGWPVAAVLLLVWSMYLVAVRYVWRVAALGSQAEDLPPFDSRRSP